MSEKMIFCVGEGQYESKGIGYQKNLMMFNEKVTEKEYQDTVDAFGVKKFVLSIAKWIDIKEVKSPTKEQTQMGGYLKTLNYEEAWQEMWAEMKTEDKNFFKNLPHFNADIFKEITGIEITDEPNLSGTEVSVTIAGKTYSAIIK